MRAVCLEKKEIRKEQKKEGWKKDGQNLCKVRNIIKILGSHQKVWEANILDGKSEGVLSDAMLSLLCPWIEQVLAN
jgi:hypothetical protein